MHADCFMKLKDEWCHECTTLWEAGQHIGRLAREHNLDILPAIKAATKQYEHGVLSCSEYRERMFELFLDWVG